MGRGAYHSLLYSVTKFVPYSKEIKVTDNTLFWLVHIPFQTLYILEIVHIICLVQKERERKREGARERPVRMKGDKFAEQHRTQENHRCKVKTAPV